MEEQVTLQPASKKINSEESPDFSWSGCCHLTTKFRSKGTVDVGSWEDDAPSYRSSCCYGSYFSEFRGRNDIEVIVYADPFCSKNYSRHTCFLSKEQLLEHVYNILPYLPDSFVEKLEITLLNPKEVSGFSINLTLNGENIYYRVLLTWIRMAYEFPYSVITLDTFRFKDRYERISPLNLFRLFGMSIRNTESKNCLWRSDQSMTHFGLLYPKSAIIQKLIDEASLEGDQFLSNVFNDKCYDHPEEFKNIIESFGSKAFSKNFWLSDEEAEKRLEIYNQNLEYINHNSPFSIYEEES